MTKKYPRLLRRKHTFYLRIAIPRDIQHLALRKEFLYSLNTMDYLLAIKLYHIESVAMDKFITLLRVFAMRVSKRAYFIKENLRFTDDTNNPFNKLTLQIIGSIAEFERNMIKMRQAEGIAIAKQKGVYSKERCKKYHLHNKKN